VPNRFFALVIHDRPFPFETLKSALKVLNIEVSSVSDIERAKRLIPQTEPYIVFTDTTLPDGSWMDVLEMADQTGVPTRVIVVSPQKDIKLYWSAFEKGAYDFILPPFELEWLDLIVQRAGDDVRRRRQAQAHAAAA
jgi:DNA-binding NtrC family response regulator